MKVADIIVPRGGENMRAIDLIVRQINNQLIERGNLVVLDFIIQYFQKGRDHLEMF